MRLRMLVHTAGAGFDLSPGDVTDIFAANEAAAMISRGYAVPDDSVPIERAVQSPAPEKRRRGRPAKVVS